MRGVVLSLAVTAMTAMVAVAAPTPEVRPVVTAMIGVDGNPCGWLLSERGDGCKRLARHSEPGFTADVYQAGSRRGIRRVVLVVTAGGQRMASPGIDLLGEACDDRTSDGGCVTLDTARPSVQAVAIDGRAGVMLRLVSTFARSKASKFQTESLIGCAPTAGGPWKCSTLDLGSCAASVGSDGQVETSCGTRASLSLR